MAYKSDRQLRAAVKKLVNRGDVTSDGLPPKDIQVALAQQAGLNPYGEPRYRLVLAQCVFEWHGGEFLDWPKGTTLPEQGGMVMAGTQLKKSLIKIPGHVKPLVLPVSAPVMKPSEVKPLRRFVGMRWVKRYPTIKGWILQMWRPAQHFGSRETWNTFTYKGNPEILMLGPYPEKGAYEIAGERVERDRNGIQVVRDSWPEVPPIGLLRDMIAFWECDHMKDYGASPEARIAFRLNEYHYRLKAQEERDRQEQLNFIRDTMKPYMGSSLEAGRMREELARRAGITEHVGN